MSKYHKNVYLQVKDRQYYIGLLHSYNASALKAYTIKYILELLELKICLILYKKTN
jgi:CRISPR/Cas system-associated endonuclease/helicase Cas3